MIDKDAYPQTAKIAARCVHMLADLWNAPGCRKRHGMRAHRLITGGHAGRAVPQMAMHKPREAEGKPADRPKVICARAGSIVIRLALIGTITALLPAVMA